MRPGYAQSRSMLPSLLWLAGLLGFGAVGTVGTLFAMGKLELPFMKKMLPDPNAGRIAVPLSQRAISAYTKVSRDDIINPKNGQPGVVWFTPEEVEKIKPMLGNAMFGRVLKHDKKPQMIFKEDDFYPQGTLPGFVAGCPEGKRVLAIAPGKIKGSVLGLHQGDKIDLVASMLMQEKNPAKASKTSALTHDHEEPEEKLKNKTLVKVIVSGALVLQPATAGHPASPGKPADSGKDLILAVEPEEVTQYLLTQSAQAELTCFAHSGRLATRETSQAIPDSIPEPAHKHEPPPPPSMELIQGTKRQVVVFPKDASPSYR